MAEHRFYVGDDAWEEPSGELTLAAGAAQRVAQVLRMRPGQRLALFGDGREFECELVTTGREVRVRLLEELPPEALRPRLTLYQALIRPNRFEWLIEKVTELGATAIVPIMTERGAVRATEIGESRLERWRRIATEATEQSGRREVPSIFGPLGFAAALKEAEGRKVLAWEDLRDSGAPRLEVAAPQISLFVGPEGGWTKAEVERARKAGAVLMGLGPNILRAETAAIVATALLLLD
jgi:16S rRNA (uracil1498-N3)-methyltransferase